MDTKSKNSRKFGILILILLLAASSAVMMLQYGTIRRQIESVQEEGSDREKRRRIWRIRWRKAIIFFIIGMYGTLIRRKYFLFTDSKGLIWQKKYLDYELIDSKDEVIASDLPEEEQEKLHEDGKEYAFRVKYIFSENGDLEDIQIGGTAFGAEEAYNMESIYINEVESVESYGQISSITTLTDVTFIYGITEENLEAYGNIIASENGEYLEYYNISYTTAFRDTLEMLSVLLIAAAILMPFVKCLDLSEMKVFRASFEVAGAGALFFAFGGFDIMAYVVYHTVKGRSLPAGFEPALLVANFLLWMFMFGILFWCVTSLRAMFRMKKAYWTERTLTAKMLRKMKNKGEESGGKIQKKVKSIGRKIRNFFCPAV